MDAPVGPDMVRLRRWLTIVGIGEDGVAGLSAAAIEHLSNATTVFGGKRHLALAASVIRGEIHPWASPLEATIPELLARRGTPTCVLASGDPFYFGIGATLARDVAAEEIVCLPQPSAFSLAAARLGWPLQDCACVSLHGRSLEQIVPLLQPGRRILALSWDGTTPGRLASLLTDRGFGPSALTVLERMGGAEERVQQTVAEAPDFDRVSDLNTIGLQVSAAPGTRTRPFTPGLPDSWFEHDGQITKSPMRALTLAALAPRFGELLWDVGAGSGSVGIEWLLSDGSTRAVAIDRRTDRNARVERNAKSLGVAERLSLVGGDAPSALVDLPRPNAIFIGGGLTIDGVLDRCRSALHAEGRLVANAVTVESQQSLIAAYREFGGELVTVGIATAEPVGGFHGLRPAMTVWQWRWTKP